jgi:hypothetical protein
MRASVSIIWVNWKAVASRIGWWWTALPAVAAFAGWLEGPVNGMLFALAFLFGGFGRLSADHWGEVENKPFSFPLPGHRESVRASYFSSAVLFGLGIAFFVLEHAFIIWSCPPLPGPSLPRLSLNMLTGFLVGTAFSLSLGASHYAVASRMRGIVLGLGFPLVVFALLLPGVISKSLFVRWGVLPPVSLVLCGLYWVRLGDMRYVGQGHRFALRGPPPPPVLRRTPKHAPPQVQGFFLRRMERYEPLSLGRSCWGGLYRSFALILSFWRIELVAALLGATILSFAGVAIAGIGLVCFGLMVSCVPLPLIPDPALLLPAGRKERCLATGLIIITVSLLSVAFGLLVIALSWFFWLSISAALGAHAASKVLTPIDPVYFYWSCVPVPWMSIFRLYSSRAARIVCVGTAAVVILLFIAAFPLPWQMVPLRKIHILYAGALPAGWLFLLVTLWINGRAHDFPGPGVCVCG